ncbi:S1 family peptidase [Actinokineospora guangxiensis]|uniref:S1 family peptidase n=1 Tax=Actinokineospora guangxiensis TaxID=1490288 RepID=A0ABW0EWR9_9PSEU
MKKTKLALAITAAACALLGAAPAATAAPAAPPADFDVQPLIIGGGNASNAPWAARLFTNGRETCSASIIAPTYILTARHCVDGSGISFRVGSLDQHSGGTLVNAVQIYRHSSDLAIARIDRSISTTYAPLGTTSHVAVGQNVQIYGWGATSRCGSEINCQARYLKVGTVRVTSTTASDAYGGLAIRATRVDAIAAGGDSGGPMFSNGRQVGVASTSDRVSVTNYTNVTRYRSWIQSIAGV